MGAKIIKYSSNITRMFLFIKPGNEYNDIKLCFYGISIYILEPQERVASAIERGKARNIVLHADLGGGHKGKHVAIATAKKGKLLLPLKKNCC